MNFEIVPLEREKSGIGTGFPGGLPWSWSQCWMGAGWEET